MSLRPLQRRVEMLENQVNTLGELPARVGAVEVQLIELRRDVSSFRDEFVSFRADVRNEFASVRGEAVAMEERLRASIDDARRQMQILHEEVIGRIALLQEGLGAPPGARAGATRRRSRKRR